MKAEQSGDNPTYEEFDPEKFAGVFESVVSAGRVDKAERLEEIIYNEIFYDPESAVALYARLAGSELEEVREVAATGIAKAFKCDPDDIARAWNSLLNDPSPGVAEAAYLAFDEFCGDMESGLEHHRELGDIAPGVN